MGITPLKNRSSPHPEAARPKRAVQSKAGASRFRRLLAGALPFVVVLAAWEIGWRIAQPPLAILPTPLQVWNVLAGMVSTGELTDHVLASLRRLAIGSAVGTSTGIILGVAGGLSRRTAEFLRPLLIFFTALSGIVWIPLAIAWFGLGTAMVTFIIWNSVFFLVFGNTVLGAQLVPKVYEDGLRSLGASKIQVILQVTIPGALPYMMAGIRSGLGFGWRALIAAELVGAASGLGYLIYSAAEFHRTDIIIGGCIVIGALGFLLDRGVLARIERRTVERWGTKRTEAAG
ncbi:MAG: ABC transporter permease subunit [Nitriliruptorales bacterium]|nr:ABC transporter permease subunit [Nitriliruptorales bacterium]